MTKSLITGLHHVTALASSPQQNVNFYAGILGLRLVKKTINFDAPDVYHLYYGDETGQPGSIMTFFPFNGIQKGRHGIGQAATTTFSIPLEAVDYWKKRFDQFKVNYKHPQQRFDEVVIYFEDFDGLGLELIANDRDDRPGFSYGQIPLEYAIRGFYSVELWEQSYERTEALLVNQLNHEFIAESGMRRRYAPKEGHPGQIVDIVWHNESRYGVGGAGTVHHIAFDTPSDPDQLKIREQLMVAGFHPTHVLDRQYFHSIYFREPGGVLFEVATTPPGFTFDESVEELGTGLMLPPWSEFRREYIEGLLEPITLNLETYA
ncbi:MAG: ring-cleaving dioxygenase [Bacteroidota bacterium]